MKNFEEMMENLSTLREHGLIAFIDGRMHVTAWAGAIARTHPSRQPYSQNRIPERYLKLQVAVAEYFADDPNADVTIKLADWALPDGAA